jgi:hypothetical protein
MSLQTSVFLVIRSRYRPFQIYLITGRVFINKLAPTALHFPLFLPRPLLPVVKMLPPKALSAKLATNYGSGYVLGELFTDPYKMGGPPNARRDCGFLYS